MVLLAEAQPGTVDWSFDPGVSVALNLDETEGALIEALAVQPGDGKVLLGGRFQHYQGVPRPNLVRTFPNGVIDLSYSPPFIAAPWFVFSVKVLAVDSGGGCLVGGTVGLSITDERRLLRLHGNGALDTAFLQNIGTGPGFGDVSSIAVRGNGNIIVGGSFTEFNGHPRPGIAELDASGNLLVSQTFLDSFSFSAACSGWLSITKVSEGPSGSVLVCGNFTHYGSLAVPGLAMFDSSGAIVTSHVLTLSNGSDECGRVRNFVVDSSGAIVVAGEFILVNGVQAASLARILPNGMVDDSFVFNPSLLGCTTGPQEGIILSDRARGYLVACGVGQSGVLANLDSVGSPYGDFVNAACASPIMALAPSGNILVAGVFTSCGGVPRIAIAQVHGRHGPALWHCLGTQPLSLPANDSIEVQGDTATWHELEVGQCMRLTVRTCDNSNIVSFSDGLYTSCPAYPDSIIPFTSTLPNACGGEDRIIEDLLPGTYWLAVDSVSEPYTFTMHTVLCGPPDCLGVPGGAAQPGSACDDGDPETLNDAWTADCICAGTPDLNLDCTGTPDGVAVPGTPCDDGIFFTTNDTWTSDCVCAGSDCEGVQGGTALPGMPCDDQNPDTAPDIWSVDCQCGSLTGVNETSAGVGIIAVRPNPVSGQHFELLLDRQASVPLTVRLLDTSGRVVRAAAIPAPAGSVLQVDRGGIPAGFYVAELSGSHGRSVHRVVLQ